MCKHILVPTDGSPLSDKAIVKAISLARKLDARMTVMHVVDHDYHADVRVEGYITPEIRALKQQFQQELVQRGKRIVEAAKKNAEEAGVHCDTAVVSGDIPYAAIVKLAGESQCDLIVMASHGRRGLEGLLIGSETVRVLTHTTIPVLVCR